MGNSKSKDAEQNHADKIIRCLKTHRTNIERLAEAVKAQKAYVELLMNDVSNIRQDNGSVSEETEEKADESNCQHFTSRWKTNTRTLLSSFQNSLEYQIDSLLKSFKSLNAKIHRTINDYKLDTGSSVDEMYMYDANSIPDEEAPQMICYYKECLKEASVEIGELKDSEKKIEEEKLRLLEANKSAVKRLKEIKESLQRCCGNVESLADQMVKQKESSEQNVDHEESSEQTIDQNESSEQRFDQKELSEQKFDQKETLEQKLTEIELLVEKNETDKENLERHLKYLKMHRPVSVQLFHKVKGDIVDKMLDELKSLLADHMGIKRQELQFIVCFHEADVNPELPLLVICMKASRLGTDITTAIQHLKVSSNAAVLIFHHKDLHALPKQTSSRVLTGPEFKSLGGIFDIAFLAEKGIYPCDMNTNAAVAIHQFIKLKY